MTVTDGPERPTLNLDAILAHHRRNPRDRSMCECGSVYERCEVGTLVVEAHNLRAAVRDRDARIAALKAEVERLRAWSLTLVSEVNAARTAHAALVERIDAEAQVRAMRFHNSACMFLPDLRERIAQAIDQTWAEAKDTPVPDVVVYGAHPVGYRDGYLDGLEHAEGIARSTPLAALLDRHAPEEDR